MIHGLFFSGARKFSPPSAHAYHRSRSESACINLLLHKPLRYLCMSSSPVRPATQVHGIFIQLSRVILIIQLRWKYLVERNESGEADESHSPRPKWGVRSLAVFCRRSRQRLPFVPFRCLVDPGTSCWKRGFSSDSIWWIFLNASSMNWLLISHQPQTKHLPLLEIYYFAMNRQGVH
jgi:hypothetical protein